MPAFNDPSRGIHSLVQSPYDLIISGNDLIDTPELCFANLAISQSNQIDNQD
jgi:hypothetical protein